MAKTLVLCLFLLTSLTSKLDLWGKLQNLAEPVHGLCLKATTVTSPYQELYQALLCGADLKSSELQHIFIHSGLIHILVVSGSHLLLIHSVLCYFTRKRRHLHLLSLFVLFVYVLACQANPPVTRAWLALSLNSLFNGKVKATQSILILQAGLLTLLLFPNWATSLSLQLSWAASLLLAAAHVFLRKNNWQQNTLIHLGLMPVLARLMLPSPHAILVNATLAPLLSAVFLPMAALTVIFPPLTTLTDIGWSALLFTLKEVNRLFTWEGAINWGSSRGTWLYLMVLHGVIHLGEVHWRRSKNFQSL